MSVSENEVNKLAMDKKIVREHTFASREFEPCDLSELHTRVSGESLSEVTPLIFHVHVRTKELLKDWR